MSVAMIAALLSATQPAPPEWWAIGSTKDPDGSQTVIFADRARVTANGTVRRLFQREINDRPDKNGVVLTNVYWFYDCQRRTKAMQVYWVYDANHKLLFEEVVERKSLGAAQPVDQGTAAATALAFACGTPLSHSRPLNGETPEDYAARFFKR